MSQYGFSHFAAQAPGAAALIDTQNRHWSRGELAALVNQLTHAFKARGLSKGDVVALIAPNSPEFLAIYLAATQMGLYLVLVNWHLSSAEIAFIVKDCAAGLVIAHQRLCGVVRTAVSPGTTIVTIGRVAELASLDDFIAGYSTEPTAEISIGRAMLYTSATTGTPRAVQLPLPESNIAQQRSIELHVAVGILPESHNVHLCASMLYHGAPLEGAVIALHMGHVVVLVDRWEPEALLRLIETHGVTTAVMVPTMFVRMLKLHESIRARYSMRTLRHVIHTGAPCPFEVKRQMIEWWGPVLWESYGATEGAGTIVSSEQWLRYPGTVGKPIPGSRIRILDDQGNDLPSGEVGHVYLTRFAGDRFEYRGDPEKTRACHRGEFFTVGDIGYLNEAGFLFICDRQIDMIICAGAKIYAAEIERVLVLHPEVADCAVLGIPDELLGECIQAVIQPMPGVVADARLSADILRFLLQQLAPSKLPKRIKYVRELPRAPNGKLYKRHLRAAGAAPVEDSTGYGVNSADGSGA